MSRRRGPGISRDVAEGGLPQPGERVLLMRLPLRLAVRHRHLRRLHQQRVHLAHRVVLRQLAAEYEQVFLRLDEVGHIVLHRRGIVLQMRVEEGEDRLPQLRRVAVRREILHEIELRRHSQRGVLMPDAVRDVAIARWPPQHVLAAGGDQEGARGNERADVRPAPALVVDPEGAIAVAVRGAIHGHALDAAALAHRHHHLHALIRRAEEPRHRATTAETGHAHLFPIHIRTALEVVERAHGIPHLGARRCVATTRPVPASVAMGAVMESLALAELHRIKHERHIAMLAEPSRVRLVGRVYFPFRVAAEIEHGRKLPGDSSPGGRGSPPHARREDSGNESSPPSNHRDPAPRSPWLPAASAPARARAPTSPATAHADLPALTSIPPAPSAARGMPLRPRAPPGSRCRKWRGRKPAQHGPQRREPRRTSEFA